MLQSSAPLILVLPTVIPKRNTITLDKSYAHNIFISNRNVKDLNLCMHTNHITNIHLHKKLKILVVCVNKLYIKQNLWIDYFVKYQYFFSIYKYINVHTSLHHIFV